MDSKIVKSEADGAILAGDHWLRQNGIISDFQLNTIMAYVYVNFPKTVNVELDLDKQNQRIFVRVHFQLKSLVWMFLARKRQAVVDDIFIWLCEYLPTYQVSVDLVRAKPKSRDSISARSRNPELKPDDLEPHSSLNEE